jgi:hypothetical protein
MPQPVITTARTARLDLPYLFPGQAQKEAFVNEALARLDGLVQPAVLGERPDPPAAPAPGDAYIVAASPTGPWSGQAGAIAVWAESQWLFTAPVEGLWVHDRAAGCRAFYAAAGGWQRATTPVLPAGGGVVDAEARTALSAIVAELRRLGIFA